MNNIISILTVSLFLSLSSAAQNYNTKSTLTDAQSSTGTQDKGILAKKTGVKNVVIVYKTHFDIGYSERVQQVLHDYRTAMVDRVPQPWKNTLSYCDFLELNTNNCENNATHIRFVVREDIKELYQTYGEGQRIESAVS